MDRILSHIKNPRNLVIIVIVIVIFYFLYKYYFKSPQQYSEGYNNISDAPAEIAPLNTQPKVPTIINFNTVWCRHSKEFQPIWEEFSTSMQGKNIKVIDMKCDEAENEELCQKFDIPGYPTVILFMGDDKHVYEGPRTVGALSSFCDKFL